MNPLYDGYNGYDGANFYEKILLGTCTRTDNKMIAIFVSMILLHWLKIILLKNLTKMKILQVRRALLILFMA